MPRPAKPWYRAQKNSWYATIGGSVVSLGVQGRANRKAALATWYRLMADEKTQPVESAEPTERIQANSVTIASIATAFLDDARSRLKPNTLIWYERSVEGLAKTFGTTTVDSLSVEAVERWLRTSGWGDTTQNHVIGVLNVFFAWCVRRRLIPANPLSGIAKPPRRSRGDEAIITREDHVLLLEAATPPFHNVLVILHATGARPSEVLAITAENFDPTGGLVRLKEHKTAHHGKRRIIYLSPDANNLLTSLREKYPSGPLLRNRRGQPWVKDSIVLAMRRLRKKTGIRATAYYYRHTFATDALAAGVPDAQVAELLGHASTTMLHRHYSHLATKSKVLTDAVRSVR
jgi:integrase